MSTRRCATALACLVSLPWMAQGQRPDTSMYTPTSELRLGVSSASVKRAVSGLVGLPSRATATVQGLELFYRAIDGGGVVLRYEKGNLGGGLTNMAAGKLDVLDGAVLIGGRMFNLTVGYRMRTFMYSAEERRMGLARAGIEVGRMFEGAGFDVRVAGSYIRTVREDKADSIGADGIEAQTTLTYVPPRLPIYVQLGYRRETFNLLRTRIRHVAKSSRA